MLDMNGIVEKMKAEGFEVTAEEVAEVHCRLKDGRMHTGLDREIARLLQDQSERAMSDGQVENAGF